VHRWLANAFLKVKSKVSGANFGNVLLSIFIGSLLLGVSIYLDGENGKKNTEICIIPTKVYIFVHFLQKNRTTVEQTCQALLSQGFGGGESKVGNIGVQYECWRIYL
jgi:hypothetical protein